jgi:hypothetical protein
MRKINKIVDEYLSFDIDCDMDSEDGFINTVHTVRTVRNKDNDDVTNKKEGIYGRFRNLFRACFV